MPTKTINLSFGSAPQKYDYDIHIGSGLIENPGSFALLGNKRCAIITDENVAGLYLDKLLAALKQKPVKTIILPAGEQSKSFAMFEHCINELLQAGFGRNDTIIAFGGGVIGDLAGFVASTIKRGCNYLQIPTTLLAQIDSSVGGKTAINSKFGKNLVGTFYQPEMVLIDIDVLSSLGKRQIRAGYAEILKYSLIDQPDFFTWLEQNGQRLLAGDKQALKQAIIISCKSKADIVARDEREKGERALLNLGHSFGHALEAEAGYDGRLLHGEAVSAGMLMAFEFSHELGYCPKQDVEKLRQHLLKLQMPVLADILGWLKSTPKQIFTHMKQDKKNKGENINLVLTRGIGGAFIGKNIDQNKLLGFLQKVMK